MIPIMTILGFRKRRLIRLVARLIIESIFVLPGVGQLAIDAIFRRDFPLVQGVVLFIALWRIPSSISVWTFFVRVSRSAYSLRVIIFVEGRLHSHDWTGINALHDYLKNMGMVHEQVGTLTTSKFFWNSILDEDGRNQPDGGTSVRAEGCAIGHAVTPGPVPFAG